MKWWQIKKKDADLERELRSDLKLEEEEQRECGVPPEEAYYAARRAFGNLIVVREQTRAIWSWNWFESFASDLRHSLRSLCRTPLLTLIVVLALSIGMGLNVGIFSILNSMFLQPPTRTDPASFVQIYPRYDGWFAGAAQSSRFNADDFNAIRTQTRSRSDVAAWDQIEISLDDLHRHNSALLVTCNYFHVLGMDRVIEGRFFLPNECDLGTEMRIVVLSEHSWRNLYASDPKIVGLFCGLILTIPIAHVFASMTKRSALPIHAFDFSVYCISALILLVISVCAMSLPGLRATRVDPIQALRSE